MSISSSVNARYKYKKTCRDNKTSDRYNRTNLWHTNTSLIASLPYYAAVVSDARMLMLIISHSIML